MGVILIEVIKIAVRSVSAVSSLSLYISVVEHEILSYSHGREEEEVCFVTCVL